MWRTGTQNLLPPPSSCYFALKQESTRNSIRWYNMRPTGWPENRIDVFYSFCPYFIWAYLPQNWKEQALARTSQPEVLSPYSYSSHKTHYLNPPSATYTIWASDIWRGVSLTRGAQHEQASPQPDRTPLGTVTRLLARVNPGSWPPGCMMETLARNVTWFYSDQFYRYTPPPAATRGW